ncbi:MAG TPA: ABC-2 family transporter protein [Myxococcales bacterium]|jgi:ABC-2 type transport system permease protein|nr:ABC-2 family transporter protein [Myxococcales bacterium]
MTPLRRPGPLHVQVLKVLGVLGVTLTARAAYAGQIALRALFLGLILFSFSQLWAATSLSVDVRAVTGFTITQLIWYLAFTEATMSGIPFREASEVDQEVKSGDIAIRLVRPLPYPAFHFGAQMGDRFLRFALNLAVGVPVAFLVSGPLAVRPLNAAAAVVAAVLALAADWTWAFSISLLAFWVEDTNGLQLLYRRATWLLGGLLVPLEAYPDWLANVARALPFRFLVMGPARLFVTGGVQGLPALLLAEALYGAAGLVPLLLLYRLGLRRVTAQGG